MIPPLVDFVQRIKAMVVYADDHLITYTSHLMTEFYYFEDEAGIR